MKLLKPSFQIEAGVFGDEALRLIEQAARTCYKSEPAGDPAKFVKRLIKTWQAPRYESHESTIEHVGFTVRFICDRGVSHELVRHRLAAFSQESTRYVDYAGDKTAGHCQFIIPPWVNVPAGIWYRDSYGNPYCQEAVPVTDPGTVNWMLALLTAETQYLQLRELKWSPQQARTVLPNSTKTEIVMTASAREFRHILIMRALNKAAHPQMRELMIPLLLELHKRVPVLFDDLVDSLGGTVVS